MFFLAYFFSPLGRFRTLDYNFVWIALVLLNLSAALLLLILGAQLGFLERDAAGQVHFSDIVPMTALISVFIYIWTIACGVIFQSATIKRSHDLNLSAWYFLSIFILFPVFFVVPMFLFFPSFGYFLIAVNLAVILYFMLKLSSSEGRHGDNQYGISPYPYDHPFQFRHALLMILTLLGTSLLLVYPAQLAYNSLPVRALSTEAVSFDTTSQKPPQESPLAQLKRQAEKGDAVAQYELGFLYTNGQGGVLQDDKEAIKWLRKAALQGYAFAQYSLGVFYATGQGIPADNAEAFFWLTLGVNGGYDERVEKKYFLEATSAKLSSATRATVLRRVREWQPKK